MRHTIPFDYQITVDGNALEPQTILLEYSQKEINEIISFIDENQYYDCELCNMPGSYFDEVMAFIEEDIGRYLKKNKIQGNEITWCVQPFLSPNLINLFPDELKAKLHTDEICEFYELKTLDEILTYCVIEFKEQPKKEYKEGTFMKTLAIRQPWASLIALGIKDVELRDAMPTKPRKIFIAASGTMVPWEELDEMVQTLILNLKEAGIMPEYKKWPTKCIIGHVDIVKASFDHVDSVWGRDWEGMKYTLRNAELLDEPIYGLNKATPYFYNVEGYSENHLPKSHKVDLSGINLPK